MTPKISCLLVAPTSAALLKQAVDCFSKQNYDNRELIIASGPGSPLGNELAALQASGIRCVKTEGTTVLDALMAAFTASSGDYVACWPTNAYSDPLRLSFQMEILQAEKADIVYLSSITYCNLSAQTFGLTRDGLWANSVLAVRSHFLESLPSTTPSSVLGVVDSKIKYTWINAPDLLTVVTQFPPQKDAQGEDITTEAIPVTAIEDICKIVERIKYPDLPRSSYQPHEHLLHAVLLSRLDEVKSNQHYEAFLGTPLASEQFAFDVLMRIIRTKRSDPKAYLALCTKALLLDASRPEAFNLLGIYNMERGNYASAIPFFHAALVSASSPRVAGRVEAHYTWIPYDCLSACYNKLGNYTEAIKMNLEAQRYGSHLERLRSELKTLVERVST